MVVLNILLGLLVITGVFAALFRYLPDVDIQWSDVFLGAFFTAVLFTIGKYLIGLYLGQASFGSTYGAAGSLVVVLVWVYYSAQIMFFGAEFTQVYAGEHGSDPQKTRLHPKAVQPKVSPTLDAAVASSGNSMMSSTGQRRTGIFGSLLGSALAARRIVRGFRDR
jgi:membrane protein